MASACAEKGDHLEGVSGRTWRTARTSRRPSTASGTHEVARDSGGHRIDQHIVECGAAMDATANGETETQRRSYPGIRGQYGTRGWELVRELDLPGNAARIAEEARAADRRGARATTRST